jgi:RNA polymerase sigma-70 factor (ECF subfamily)
MTTATARPPALPVIPDANHDERGHGDTPGQLDRLTHNLIRKKARRLFGRAGLTAQDREDVEQELTVRLLWRLRSLHPGKDAHPALIPSLIRHCAANLLRDRLAQKRCARVVSLSFLVDIGEASLVELAQLVTQGEYGTRLGINPRSDEERARLAFDVQELLPDLPAELRDLAEQLKTRSVSEIAREQGVPRTSLYAPLRRLRQHCEKVGLNKYLERPSSSRRAPG